PEYDTFSLLKEYRREVELYKSGQRPDYPPLPDHYFNDAAAALARDHQQQVVDGNTAAPFPEEAIAALLDNSWADSARAALGAWIGLVYQTTHMDRRKLYMDGIDPANPLNL